MIPTQSQLEGAALRVERGGAARGWDAEPLLLVLHSIGADDPLACFVLPFIMAPKPPSKLMDVTRFLHGPSGMTLAKEVATPPLGEFAGVALLFEAWGFKGPLDEEYVTGHQGIADMMGSVEVRIAALVDCGGRVVYAARERGGNPMIEDASPDSRILTGLASIVKAIARHLPPAGWDPEALNRLKD